MDSTSSIVEVLKVDDFECVLLFNHSTEIYEFRCNDTNDIHNYSEVYRRFPKGTSKKEIFDWINEVVIS